MTRNSAGRGGDLTADLLADLARPLSMESLPKPATPLRAVDSVSSTVAREAHGRGPALDGSLRISPIDWSKPSLSIGVKSATIRFGPVHAALVIRVG